MTSAEFENQFLVNFAKNINRKKLKKKHVIKTFNRDYYLWNLFGCGLLPCLSGNEAREEYDKVDKNEAFEIQYDNGFVGDEATLPLSQEHMTSAGIDTSRLAEFYVVGKEFSWCYVVTHEFDRSGPFFCYKPQ